MELLLSTEIALFLLRLVSSLLLVSFLAALLVIIWRDYRAALEQVAATRRTYGQLVELRKIDGNMVITGEVYPLLAVTSLGRAPTNSIAVEDSFASSEHALVVMRNDQWWLEDRRSRNGTTLNDMPVAQPIVITHGDIIGIGNLCYRVELN